MKQRTKTTAVVVAFAALVTPAFSAIMAGLTSDANLNEDLSLGNLASATVRAGSSSDLGGGRNGLFVFQLGDFGAVANPYLTADLRLTVSTLTGAPNYNVDLYGLGRQTSSTLTDGSGVLATNRFYEANATDPNATLIQTDFITTTTGTAGATLNTNLTGDANLLAFLNAQYASGAGANQFIVIRANPDADTGTTIVGYNLASADNPTAGLRPEITFTAIPEPSSSLLASLAGLLLFRRRR